MSARIPPGFAEMWAQFNVPGDPEPMFISCGFDVAAGETPTLAITNSIMAIWDTNFDNVLSSSYTVGPGHIVWGNDGGDIRIDATNTPQQGDIATVASPQNAAILCRKLTAAGGRRGRGRFYVPGIPRDKVNEIGTIDGTHLSNFNSALDDIFSTLIAHAVVDALVLFHESAPHTPTAITDLVAVSPLATQRRRLRP